MVHTGQHYDSNMSQVFFDELDIAPPQYNLGVESGSHGEQVGRMLIEIEKVLEKETPDWVLVYGDTNSTLAGALAAAKLRLRVAHVEAGLRSFNRAMPEEINRVLADHVSDLLFCPSQSAIDNLSNEGIRLGVHLVGDVMLEALGSAKARALVCSTILRRLNLRAGEYLLATVHRAENTDRPDRLKGILNALDALEEDVVFPVHPRTQKMIAELGWTSERSPGSPRIRFIEPVGYLDMVMMEQAARIILTDSGGVQKEAYWLGVPCITMRNETEWVETVEQGWNTLVGADTDRIVGAVLSARRPNSRAKLYGEERPSIRCIRLLEVS